MQLNWLTTFKTIQIQESQIHDGPSDILEMSSSPRSWPTQVALQAGLSHCIWSFARSHGCKHSRKSAKPN